MSRLSNIEKYMTLRGWLSSSLLSFPNLLTYTHAAMPGRQLFLPIRESEPDFADSWKVLLGKLASIEHTTAYEIERQLEREETSPTVDGMALRILGKIADSESIPLSLANEIIGQTEIILMSASCTAEKPSHYFRRIDNKISNEIYNRSVFNHTRHGSFIMSVSCPIASPGEQLGFGLDPNEWTKSRRAFISTFRGIKILSEAIKNGGMSKLIDETLASTTPIVSSNFCEALGNIISKDSGNGIDISFDWSMYIPLPLDIEGADSILMTPNMADELYLFSEALRPEQKSLDDSFIGTVEALRGDVNEAGERAGAVEFLLLLKDGITIRASAFLNQDQYKLADKAHIGGARYISISGKLDPHPRIWTFDGVRSFSLVESMS